jgi:hypothetical protein
MAIAGAVMTAPGILFADDVRAPGVLGWDPSVQCTVLQTGFGGGYLLENYGTFSIGDSVFVTAHLWDRLLCYGCDGYTCLRENTIESAHGFDFGCGQLYVDTEYDCGFLITSLFGQVRLATYGDFVSGDSIAVTGDFGFECRSIPECLGAFCLYRNTVTACVTPIHESTWGSIKARFR